MLHQRKFFHISAISLLLFLLVATITGPAAAVANSSLDQDTRFYAPLPNHGAVEQFAQLTSSKNQADARLIMQMAETPHAVWIVGGTPKAAMQQVRQIVSQAADKGVMPVLVAYNIPFRDCAQYSAGGATSVAEYEAWIDGFAAGIGSLPAVVLLEPDGLGIIPWYNPFGTGGLEWCQPAEADPATAAADRFTMMNYAVNALKAKPATMVYLDATHSGWLGAGDAADRLIKAGVANADGFFLNVSNYELTDHLVKYGTWVSGCITYATFAGEGGWRLGHTDWCASQYYPANPNDFSTWTLTDDWYNLNVFSQYWFKPEMSKHFVIDTSRNGQGPWKPEPGKYTGDPQVWCNPPDRGVGRLPTANTGVSLVDAYLWVKIPGESDGQCNRSIAGSTTDPEWGGIVDPAAGSWFPQMALDLAKNANPPLP